MQKPETELIIIEKTYNLIIWSCQRIANFPRDKRYSLGERLECRLYDILDKLIRAKFTQDRNSILRDINLDLEMLRFQFRLAKDLRCMSVESYGFASRSVNEIGKLVGSWIKKLK
jgi:hypothetical protein